MCLPIGCFKSTDSDDLSFYVKSRKIQRVQEGIQKGAKPGPNTLDQAISTHDVRIVDLVIQAGGLPGAQTLDRAIDTKIVQIVQSVIKAGAGPTAQTMEKALKTNRRYIIEAVKPLVDQKNIDEADRKLAEIGRKASSMMRYRQPYKPPRPQAERPKETRPSATYESSSNSYNNDSSNFILALTTFEVISNFGDSGGFSF